jgi:TRAP-type mannitol/chloroaromatic compound transport system permease large subunit
MEIIPLLLLVLVCCALLFGYPVAFTLSGVSILFALFVFRLEYLMNQS